MKWFFVYLFTRYSYGKQLRKDIERCFAIFQLVNDCRKQANGSQDIFWPEAEGRGSEWFEAAICLLETAIYQQEYTKICEF